MPTGRHARDVPAPAQLPATPEAPTPVAPICATLEVQLATPTGRRKRALTAPIQTAESTPAPAGTGRRRRVTPLADTLDPIVEPTPAPVATGSGRRRKPAAQPVAAPVLEAPVLEAAALEAPALETPTAPSAGSGRRRKAVATVAPAAEAVPPPVQPPASIAPGSGRRRRVVPTTPVVDPAPVEVIVAAQPVADVVPIEVGHRHRAGSRHRARNNSPIPGNPALVAGAAAVALAAVGAVATTAGGVGFGSTGTELANASTLALAKLPQAAANDPGAARASRDKARDVLAARLQQQASQSALAKALKLAQLRAARLATLAKEFFLPVHSYHLTAGFGEGGGLWSHGHTGQDFACPTGTPIHALASGTIVFSGWDGAYGWKTIERLADGTEIWYAHQSKIIVHSGPVVAGQLIGLVGSTGNTTGPHLHLEVHPGGGPAVDPMPWLRAHGMHP